MDDFQYGNLGNESNVINYFYQSVALGNNHSDENDFVDVCVDECLSAPSYLSVSHEYFNLDLESDLFKDDVHIETSSSSHYPLRSVVCDASTYDKDTPCSLGSSSDDLYSRLTQGGDIFHDEIENNQIIVYCSHPSPSLLFHEGTSSNYFSHDISPIHLSLNLQSEEYFNLSNLVVDIGNSSKISDRDIAIR